MADDQSDGGGVGGGGISLAGSDVGDDASVGVLSEVDSDDDLSAVSEVDSDEDEDDDYPSTAVADNNDHGNWRGLHWCDETKKFKYDSIRHRDVNVEQIPKLTQWKKVDPRKMKQVKVVVDGGRETMVNHFVDEYQSLLAHLKALHVDPSPDGVFKYLFGEGSRLAEVMTRTLNITHKEYCVFLATFFLAAEFKHVPKVL